MIEQWFASWFRDGRLSSPASFCLCLILDAVMHAAMQQCGQAPETESLCSRFWAAGQPNGMAKARHPWLSRSRPVELPRVTYSLLLMNSTS